MDVADLVRQHYGGEDLQAGILAGLAAAGVDLDHLTVDDLSAVDQLHAGFSDATRYLQTQLGLRPQTRLLDVGCGIGGPARIAAADYGCVVTGVDLSPDFVATARSLTGLVALSDRVDFRVAGGDDLGVDDASFDAAMMVHVGMNIPDKRAVFTDVRRALREGGTFALFEQMRVADGDLPYPLPWAEDSRTSFVAAPDDYAGDLEAAGFAVVRTEDRTAQTAGPPGQAGPAGQAGQAGPARLSPMAVFGPQFAERIGNNVAATRAGLLAPVLIVARAA
ncbi:MAG TPA: class I SAM-dependent methyltransferase [Microlunatus sp.]